MILNTALAGTAHFGIQRAVAGAQVSAQSQPGMCVCQPSDPLHSFPGQPIQNSTLWETAFPQRISDEKQTYKIKDGALIDLFGMILYAHLFIGT